MQRANSLEKTLMLGKIEGSRRRGQQRMRWLDSITESNVHESEQTLGDGEGQGSLTCCSPWGHRVRHNLMTEQQLFTYVRCSIKCCICIVSLNSGGRYSHYTVTVSPGTVLCEPGMPAGLPVSSGDRPLPGCLSSVQFSRSVVSDSL